MGLWLYQNVTQKADLIGGPLKLLAGGWTPQAYTFSGEFTGLNFSPTSLAPVNESIALIGMGAAATVRGGVQTINDILRQAYDYHADQMMPETRAIWLWWQASSEAKFKQSLVYEGRIDTQNRGILNPFLSQGGAAYTLNLSRVPWWEDTAQAVANSGTLNASGQAWALPSIAGSLPARPRSTILDSITGNQDTHWFGVKPSYGVDLTNFDPVLPIGNAGTLGTDTTRFTDPNTESVGAQIGLCNFSTQAGHVVRLSYGLNAQTNFGTGVQYQGRYIALLRVAWTAPNSTVAFSLKTGQSSAFIDGREETEKVYHARAANNLYDLIELGEIRIPHDPRSGSGFTLYNFDVLASRIDGAASIYIDTIVLIPYEHFVKCKGHVKTGSYNAQVFPTGTLEVQSGGGVIGIEYSANNLYLPVGDSVGVNAMQGEDGQPLNNTVVAQIGYVPRYNIYGN